MKTEFDNREYNENLMAALGFDADDLNANNNGDLTEKQRKTLNSSRRFWKIMVVLPVVVAPIAIILTLLDGYGFHDSPSSRFGICIFIIVTAIILTIRSHTEFQKFNQDLLSGKVFGIGGFVTKYEFVGRGETAIQISGQVFRTSDGNRFRGFKFGESYTVFYTPFSNYVVSATYLTERDQFLTLRKI